MIDMSRRIKEGLADQLFEYQDCDGSFSERSLIHCPERKGAMLRELVPSQDFLFVMESSIE